MTDLVSDLRRTQKLYERAGVDGSNGALQAKAAADEIERLRAISSQAAHVLLGYHRTPSNIDTAMNELARLLHNPPKSGRKKKTL